MKALLLASFVVAAVAAPTAVNSCTIPNEYAPSSGLGNCAGSAPGYVTNIVCWNPNTPAPTFVRQPLTAATGPGFATAALQGCLAPGENVAVDAGTGFPTSTGAGITISCPIATDAYTPATTARFKGVEVNCAPNFYPVQGQENLIFPCGTSTAMFAMSQLPATTTGKFVPPLNALSASLTDANTRLQCRQGCTISDPTICQNSQLQVVGTTFFPAANTKNSVLADCIILPGKTVNFISKYGRKIVYRCDAAASVAAGAGTLVLVEGAQWLNQIRLGYEAWYYGAVGQSAIPAGSYNFDDIAGVVLRISNTVPNFRAVAPIPGLTPQTIVIDGCASVECAQRALLWARCRGFVFYNDMCFAASIQIPCPTSDRGFECPESSKKGLLGLLGLLGLIPLLLCCCLLLCCLFGPCAMRRKKSGADVQFATFDPHAAPVAQSFVAQPCAPVDYCAPTACATGYVA